MTPKIGIALGLASCCLIGTAAAQVPGSSMPGAPPPTSPVPRPGTINPTVPGTSPSLQGIPSTTGPAPPTPPPASPPTMPAPPPPQSAPAAPPIGHSPGLAAPCVPGTPQGGGAATSAPVPCVPVPGVGGQTR